MDSTSPSPPENGEFQPEITETDLLSRTEALIEMYEKTGIPYEDPDSPEVITYRSLIAHRNTLQAQPDEDS